MSAHGASRDGAPLAGRNGETAKRQSDRSPSWRRATGEL
ncbi:hypothetical protein BMAPRL20_0644 [Burkholderia mallei PRL-20]|uniref:Uncharacterized protein n=1 Tax=Burkholderia mallei (strain NCTC 10229) TaxID=412022 RepID=A2RY10_BURM9|nr:hypothetical protein BMA10229_0764 [Burkholderia mallei NCTC 10229]EDK57412.1 hypothetical protein BMAJHU_F0161 [Burkholderia mallei JHU]EDP85650.1 hypothetical protein BMA10399_G0601 [Burkholderia mallei ATCC 10399]EES43572.1 hypothetical protein BMAPRL20_0644 [Burkholderia mallei PRL-20]